MKRAKRTEKAKKEVAEGGARPLSLAEKNRIADALAEQSIRNRALREEIVFILQQRLSESKIKVHEIESRVKHVDSVLEKCERKGLQDHNLLTDVVAARVVCLFRSDMSRVSDMLRSNFEIVSIDDKLSEAGPLGYQSTHYVCRLPARYKGPRYENTAGVEFEVQVRTLCMHAWAAVSHHLDYKGDWDVPEGLKQALSALGGLFFVADNQFEQFYAARIQSELEAAKRSNTDEDQEINLDTMKSYLERKLPTRGRGSSAAISSLVKEIKKAGYHSMNDIDRDMDRGKLAFEAYEPKHPPNSGRYIDVGEVRGTLRIVSESMRDVARASREGRLASDLFKEYEDFCHLVRPE